MGAGQSAEVPGGGTEGFHVLRVHENSPGQRAGLEPFFDYIIAIGKHRLVRFAPPLQCALALPLAESRRRLVEGDSQAARRKAGRNYRVQQQDAGKLFLSFRRADYEIVIAVDSAYNAADTVGVMGRSGSARRLHSLLLIRGCHAECMACIGTLIAHFRLLYDVLFAGCTTEQSSGARWPIRAHRLHSWRRVAAQRRRRSHCTCAGAAR